MNIIRTLEVLTHIDGNKFLYRILRESDKNTRKIFRKVILKSDKELEKYIDYILDNRLECRNRFWYGNCSIDRAIQFGFKDTEECRKYIKEYAISLMVQIEFDKCQISALLYMLINTDKYTDVRDDYFKTMLTEHMPLNQMLASVAGRNIINYCIDNEIESFDKNTIPSILESITASNIESYKRKAEMLDIKYERTKLHDLSYWFIGRAIKYNNITNGELEYPHGNIVELLDNIQYTIG